jgi:hypothetical protein
MSRRLSYSQQVFPVTTEFTVCLNKLQENGVKVMLGHIWEGFDRFKAAVLDNNPPPSRENADLERDLTEMLYPHILQYLCLPCCPIIYSMRRRSESRPYPVASRLNRTFRS